MQISAIQRGIFDHRADRIEKVLLSLNLPTRVQGGQVYHDRVRYHLAPVSDIHVNQVCAMSHKLAEAMGVYRVEIDEDEESIVLDLPKEKNTHLRLIPTILDVATPLPMTAMVGITTQGRPLLINFRRKESWHLGIFSPSRVGKSELLRTLIISLALYNRPSQLLMLGIDLSGKELTVLDAVPHAHAHVAVDQAYAEEIIQWVVDEIANRKRMQVLFPDIFLVIDELDNLMNSSELVKGKLPLILQDGPKAGVHLVFVSKKTRPGSWISQWRSSGACIVTPVIDRKHKMGVGQFQFQIASDKVFAQVAWLPAVDLQQAITMILKGWRADKSPVDIKELW